MVERYDAIGRTYSRTRHPDPRIAARVAEAVGEVGTVVNVGAGTGSYEPTRFRVVAVEPSSVMIEQRLPGSAPAIRAVAEALPFADRAFDAALAVLTVHHWRDLGAGLAEMRRVAPRQVLLTFDPTMDGDFWLVADYLPIWIELDEALPTLAEIASHLDVKSIEVVPVPSDCVDGFGGAFWNRPELYLDRDVQRGISSLARMDATILDEALGRLRDDLSSGAWDDRYGHLRELDEVDLGYRLITAGP